jgi:hypothetical protein
MAAFRSFCMRERQTVLETDMRAPLACLIGAVSVVAAVFGPLVWADDLKSVVRTLNAIVNPEDSWRLEDQARRYGRPKEEHYWQSYGAGLEHQRRERGEAAPQYGGGARYGNRIDPDEAYRLEEQARHDRRPDEAHYWARYREGLEGEHQHQPR